MRRVLPAALAILLGGCYSFQHAEVSSVPFGSSVRARLTPTEAARVGDILGNESRTVEGELIEADTDGLVLKVSTSAPDQLLTYGPTYLRITVQRDAIQDIETRRLDWKRTSAVMAGGTVALAAVVVGAFAAQKEPVQGPGKGGSNALRVPFRGPLSPILSIPISVR